MFSLLVAVFVTAAPAEVTAVPDSPVAQPHASVYGSPLSTALLAGLVDTPVGGLYLPTGATWRMGPHWGLSAELAGAVFVGVGTTSAGESVETSFGPTFFLNEQSLDGFFVTLKATMLAVHGPSTPQPAVSCLMGGCPPTPSHDSSSFVAAVDAGYTWRFGHLTLSALIGAGLGYQRDGGGIALAALPVTGFNSGLAWSLNINFLRLGYAL